MGSKRKRSHSGGDDNFEVEEANKLKRSGKSKEKKLKKERKKHSSAAESDGRIEFDGTKSQNTESLGDEIVKKLGKRPKKKEDRGRKRDGTTKETQEKGHAIEKQENLPNAADRQGGSKSNDQAKVEESHPHQNREIEINDLQNHDTAISKTFAQAGPERKHQRYIVFIGNLPFSANADSVAKHFAKIQPTDIRVPAEKVGRKSRGFAFLEFDAYDRMKTCLKLYHHSLFDDGESPARKINVELTAGGGGSKSEARKAKLIEKNKKLQEERARAAKENLKRKRSIKLNGDAGGAEASAAAPSTQIGMGDVHPDRVSRVPAG